MPTRLTLTVPDMRCVACRTVATGTINHVHAMAPGVLAAGIEPPTGWARLQPDRRPDDRPLRQAFICPNCYSALDLYGQPAVTISTEPA